MVLINNRSRLLLGFQRHSKYWICCGAVLSKGREESPRGEREDHKPSPMLRARALKDLLYTKSAPKAPKVPFGPSRIGPWVEGIDHLAAWDFLER
mgnify:CR=1 FL=1